MFVGVRPAYRLLAVLAVLVTAFANMSCVWGFVRDAETGALLGGAEITISSTHNFRIALTDTNGIYCFDPALGEPVFPGDAAFVVSADGHEVLKEMRTIDYPGASFADIATFSNIQIFDLAAKPGAYRDTIAGFSVSFPSNWKVWAQPLPGLTVVEAHLGNQFDEFCGIESGPMSGSETPETWWLGEDSDREYGQRTNILISGRTATRIVYETEYRGEAEKGLLFLFARDREGWAIRCYAPENLFGVEEPLFDAVAASFQFTR